MISDLFSNFIFKLTKIREWLCALKIMCLSKAYYVQVKSFVLPYTAIVLYTCLVHAPHHSAMENMIFT